MIDSQFMKSSFFLELLKFVQKNFLVKLNAKIFIDFFKSKLFILKHGAECALLNRILVYCSNIVTILLIFSHLTY